VATVEEGRVVALAGDKTHPITRGFLCERTNKFLHLHYHAERLTSPLVRDGTRFHPVSWDAALDIVARALARIRAESGPEAVLHYRGGGSLGILKTLNDYFFECFGGARVKRGDICSGAGEAAQEADLGISEANAIEDLLHSRIILLWGKNVTTSFVHLLPILKEAQSKGTRLVVIDPVPNKTMRFADEIIRPRPGADRFLALGMARILFERGWVDPTLEEWSTGAGEFRTLAFRRPLEELARFADVSPETVTRLATLYATERPGNIQVGWGMQRRRHGSSTIRVLDALAALTGNFGVPGGGVTFYYRRRGAFDLGPYQAPPSRASLLEPLLGHEILAAVDPPVRAVVIDNGNPVATLPDSQTVARALETRELVVVLEQQMTDTAERAHVVLPVTTMLEETDLIGAYGHHYLSASRPVAERLPGTRTDLEIYQALADRLGFGDRLRGTPEEWARRLLAPVASHVSLEKLQHGAHRNPIVPLIQFENKKFATADGKFHFVTSVEVEDPEADGAASYPLQLGSFSTPEAQASQWSIPWDGEPFEARCHPSASSGIPDGAIAWLASSVGRMRVRVRHEADMHPALVVVPKGGWLRHGCAANALVRATLTDGGEGAAYYDERVRFEPAQAPADRPGP